jgi:hypothetical protein
LHGSSVFLLLTNTRFEHWRWSFHGSFCNMYRQIHTLVHYAQGSQESKSKG